MAPDLRQGIDRLDPERRTRVLAAYRQGGEERLQALENALGDGDAEALREAAHTLAGSARLLGAQDLAVRVERIEDDAFHGILPSAAELRSVASGFQRSLAGLSGQQPL